MPFVPLTYFELINLAMRLYREGKLAEAYDLVNENSDVKPGNPAQILNFRYSIASRLGDSELAMKLMREAIVDKGYWYGYEYLLEDDDLKPLQDLPEFRSLAEKCREREIEAKVDSKPSLKIMRTGESDVHRPRLLMALHGNGDSVALTENYWLSCLCHGYDLVLPQSSQITFWEGYTWNDLDKGLSELIEHLGSAHRMIGAEPKDLVLAGFSGGARLALLAVLKGEVTTSGLILVAPWLPELDSWAEDIQSIGIKGTKCWIFCGDQDRDCLEGSKKLGTMLEMAGTHVHLEIIEGLDHDFPVDFEVKLSMILNDFKT